MHHRIIHSNLNYPMIIIHNNLIPFKGFHAMNLCGLLFVRGKDVLSERTLLHERIHTRQWLEMLVIGFLLWYLIEWLIRLITTRDMRRAYRTISFEQEAYNNERHLDYLTHRRPYAWKDYL